MTVMAGTPAWDVERDLARYARQTCDFKSGANLGNVADCAFDAAAVEFNRSGFKYASSEGGTSFVHRACLS